VVGVQPPVDADVEGGVLVVAVTRPGRVAAVVLVLLVLAEVLAGAVTAGTPPPLRWYDAATELRVEMMRDRQHADVVFAGTSMAWQGLVPRVFTAADPEHRSAFNAGLAGAVPVVASRWLTSTVVPALDPAVVVWGLSSLDLAPAYGEDQLTAWTSSLQGRPGPLGVAERTASSVSTLVARRGQLRRPAQLARAGQAELVRDRAGALAITGPDGERLDFDAARTAQAAAIERARLAGFTPDVADVRAIAQTVLDLRARGVEVVLADLPIPPSLVELHPNGWADVDLAGQAVALLADELGVRHLPLGRAYADTDFVDFTHLSAQAAARYTSDVAVALARYARPDDPAPGGSEPLASWVGDLTSDEVLRPVRLAAITQVGCEGEAVPTTARTAAGRRVRQLGDATARQALEAVLAAADDVAASCGTEVRWRAAMTGLLLAIEPAVRHLEAALPAPGPATPDGAVAAATAEVSSRDLAVFAEHAYERLNWLVEGAANPRLSRNEVWWSYGVRGLVGVLDAAEAQGLAADTVVLGSSQARTGIDADLLTSLTGRRTVNAALDGGTVDVMRHWAPFVVDRAAPRRVVLAVSGVDVLTAVGPPCPTGSRDGFVAATAVAREAFAGVPWLDGAEPLSIVADPGAGAPMTSPLVAAYLPDEAQDHPVYGEEEVMSRGRPYLVAYERYGLCEDRLAVLGELVADLVGAGIEVVVVTHPVRAALLAVAPPGAVGDLEARIAAAATGAGAHVLSYTGLLDDSAMADLVHVTRDGQQALTARLAQDLGG
jgi:hypothetical protein